VRRVETRKKRTRTLGILSMQAAASSQLTLCGMEEEVFESSIALPTPVVVEVVGAKLVDKKREKVRRARILDNEDVYFSSLDRKELNRSGAEWISSHTSPRAEVLLFFFSHNRGSPKKVFVATTERGAGKAVEWRRITVGARRATAGLREEEKRKPEGWKGGEN
jgi:hypothetical protein